MAGWRRTDCGVGVTYPQGLLAPGWLTKGGGGGRDQWQYLIGL